MRVEIVGTDLPGRVFCQHDDVHVGMQKGMEVVDLVAGDAKQARWCFDVTVKPDDDCGGPYVHGRKGGRFLYLSWNDVKGDGTLEMFRRAKLWLPPRPACDASRRARAADSKGGPRCASVRPPAVEWTWQA